MPKTPIVPGQENAKQVSIRNPVLKTPAYEGSLGEKRLGLPGRSNVFLVLCLLALIVALKWATLTEPPVWDASMSVFPAAITLAENDFDVGYLLDQPGYLDGGPNVHSLSVITWLTAGVIAVIGSGPSLFPVLHLIHFLIAAFAFVGVYRLGELAFGSTLAAVTALAALTFPLVLTQVGSMYLEVALLATAVWAVISWQQGRLVMAAAFATLAVLIKGSGVFIGAALTLAALVSQLPWPQRLRSAAVLGTPPLLVGLFLARNAVLITPYSYRIFRLETTWYLNHIPDVFALLLLFAAAVTVTLFRDARLSDNGTKSVMISAAVVVIAFAGFFFVLLPATGQFFSVLPRYYTAIVPFLLIGLVATAHRWNAQAVALGALGLVIAFSIVNRNGDLYRDNDLERFALIERSGAYVALLELQQKGIDTLETLPRNIPVFYDQPVHYKLTYPLMGYAAGPIANGNSIFHETPFRGGLLADFPEEFFMLYEHPWLGGETMQSILAQALADPTREVTVKEFCVASFCSDIIHVELATVP